MILVAGIGNIFLGDDAFGSETARRLASRITAPHVRVVDYGIRGLDFAYALVSGVYTSVIIVDAVQRAGVPGTIYVIEPDMNEITQTAPSLDAHAMDPLRVLALARAMGAELPPVRIVGCEPETFGPPDEGWMSMSPAVSIAVEKAIEVVESMIGEYAVKEARV